MAQKKYKVFKCKLCDKNISSCGMPSHIKYKHNITVDEYVAKFGEFRKSIIPTSNRKCNKMICKICGAEYSTNGISMHLRYTHGITVEQYINKYGEYRLKYIDYENRAKLNKIECAVCKSLFGSERLLSYHIKKEHKITKLEYIKTYIFNNNLPLCACGCGEPVQLLPSGINFNGNKTYARTVKSGHNLNAPGYRTNTKEQKMRMRKSAINRMKKKQGVWFDNGPSKLENELYNFVVKLLPDAIQSDRKILSGLELDIVIPSLKLAIEFNGEYWHSDIFKNKKYHLNKQNEVEDKGYRLIHIWESDWIHKKEIIKSILKSIMQKSENRIYARNTVLKEISFNELRDFLSKNHLQGSSVSKYRFGLFKDTELVSVMAFSALRRATGRISKDGNYELIRFCSKLNTTVVGGASKLFTYFIKNYDPERVISYANKDWSSGKLYEQIGMEYIGNTPVGYFYSKSKFRFNRFQFQKHKLIQNGEDPNLTEYEIMIKNGYSKIWDCGNLKYEFIK